MGTETERKFLVDHKKWQALNKPAGTAFRQGYILNDNGKTIRIRIAGKQAYLTFKGPTSGITRNEYEYEIPLNDGLELFDQFAITAIEKTRYCISFEGKVWEVDVFAADNEGLIIAEIELQHEGEQFELPPWVTCEVSDEGKYYNANLSTHPFKNW